MTNHQTAKFIPALGNDLLTPLYDPLLWFMRESRFKTDLIEQAQISNGNRVLDVGCGTGTLAIMTKKRHPEAEVVGIDADSKILGIARVKAAKAGITLTFDQGMADQLPYADSSFNRVLSSLFLHHLSTEQKLRTLAEVFRILRPDGGFEVVDFGPPRTFFSNGPRLRPGHECKSSLGHIAQRCGCCGGGERVCRLCLRAAAAQCLYGD